LGYSGLFGFHIGLERPSFEPIEEIARLDLRPLGKKLLVEERTHAWHEIDALPRLDSSVELVALGYRLVFGRDHADRGRTLRRDFRHDGRDQEKGQVRHGEPTWWT